MELRIIESLKINPIKMIEIKELLNDSFNCVLMKILNSMRSLILELFYTNFNLVINFPRQEHFCTFYYHFPYIRDRIVHSRSENENR